MTPTVSVVMPVYNAERYLRESVGSILSQSFGDFELHLIDDGSTDKSLSILREFEAADQRVRLVSRANTGYTIALNEMIGQSLGKYLARMDSDDIAMPSRFDRQVSFLNQRPNCVAVGTDVDVIDEDGDTITTWNFERTAVEIDSLHIAGIGPRMVHPSAMIRADAMRSIGGYRVEMESAEDMDLWLRLAEMGDLANIDEVLLQYRVHAQSVTHTNRAIQSRLRAQIHLDAHARRGLELCELDTSSLVSADLDIPSYYLKWCWWALNSGNLRTAWKYAIRSLAATPARPAAWRALLCVLRRKIGIGRGYKNWST